MSEVFTNELYLSIIHTHSHAWAINRRLGSRTTTQQTHTILFFLFSPLVCDASLRLMAHENKRTSIKWKNMNIRDNYQCYATQVHHVRANDTTSTGHAWLHLMCILLLLQSPVAAVVVLMSRIVSAHMLDVTLAVPHTRLCTAGRCCCCPQLWLLLL